MTNKVWTDEKIKKLEPRSMVRAGIYWRYAEYGEMPQAYLMPDGSIKVINDESKVHSKRTE